MARLIQGILPTVARSHSFTVIMGRLPTTTSTIPIATGTITVVAPSPLPIGTVYVTIDQNSDIDPYDLYVLPGTTVVWTNSSQSITTSSTMAAPLARQRSPHSAERSSTPTGQKATFPIDTG